MLTMLRKPIRGQDEIIIGRFICVRIFAVNKDRVVIGIDAPDGVEIARGELLKDYPDAPRPKSAPHDSYQIEDISYRSAPNRRG